MERSFTVRRTIGKKRKAPFRAKRRRFDVPRRRLLLGELKFHDLDVDDAVVAVAGTIAEDSVLTIAEGNGESERVGRKITVQKLLWAYNIGIPALAQVGGGQSQDVVRVIVYLDKQTNGLTAGVTDILEFDDYQSFRNLSNSGRFRILMDKTHSIKGVTAGAGDGLNNDFGSSEQTYKFAINLTTPIEYDNSATTGAITSMRSNNIGVLLVGKKGIANFVSKMRIRYTDM